MDADYEGWTLPWSGRKGCVIGLAVLLLLGIAAGVVWRVGAGELAAMVQDTGRRLGPVDPAAYAPAPIAASDNVSRRLAQVETMIRPTGDQAERVRVLRASHRPAATWSAEDRAAVRRLLVANAGALARARGVSSLPGSDLGVDYDEPANPLPAVPMQGERLLRLHAALAAADGDPQVAVGSVAALGRIAEALYGEARDLPLMLGVHCEEDQLEAIRELLHAGVADPDLLTRLDAVRVSDDPFAALRRVLGYRAACRLSRQRHGELPRSTRPIPLHWRLVGPVAGDLLTVWGLRPGLAAADAGAVPLTELHRRIRDARSALPLGPWSAPRDEDGMIDGVYRLAVDRRLAEAALAVDRHRAEHGAWPQALPRPVREPVTGHEISFRIGDDGDAVVEAPEAAEVLAEARVDPTRQPLWWLLPAVPAATDTDDAAR